MLFCEFRTLKIRVWHLKSLLMLGDKPRDVINAWYQRAYIFFTYGNLRKRFMAAVTALFLFLSTAMPAQAADERRLKFYFTHTKETISIVYKRNGRYVPSALRKLNRFLRDWRQDKSTKMDPRLFDLLWSVYQQAGASKPIHVVSAYRSPKTNTMLRSRSRGVAKNSQHTRGKAMDFFIPGVSLSKLRAFGLKMEVGGVGYYPKSGSPFVHMDTGSVRHWPRMTQKQLSSVFPKGDTTHVPTNGKRMARYDQALARQQKRSAAEISPPNQRGGGLFARVFNRDQTPNAIPSTNQVLSAPDEDIPASPVTITAAVPRLKPGTDVPLTIATRLGVDDVPAPRPVPQELASLRLNNQNAQNRLNTTLAAIPERPSIPVIAPADKPLTRSVSNTWAQVGGVQSKDISALIAEADPTGEKRLNGDVAEMVMAALKPPATSVANSNPRVPQGNRVAERMTQSAAAGLAQEILTNPPETNQVQSSERSFLTAFAPTAPRPSDRPAFSAALDPEPIEDGRLKPLATDIAAITPVTDPTTYIPPVAPRSRPALPASQRAQLPTTLPRRVLANAHESLQPMSASQITHNNFALAASTRSNAFAQITMPQPHTIQDVLSLPSAIVSNRFERNSRTLRTDKFTGRAIVATRLAMLQP